MMEKYPLQRGWVGTLSVSMVLVLVLVLVLVFVVVVVDLLMIPWDNRCRGVMVIF